MRKAAAADPTYKPPSRRIEYKTLDQTFKPLVASALTEIQTNAESVQNGTAELETLEMPLE